MENDNISGHQYVGITWGVVWDVIKHLNNIIELPKKLPITQECAINMTYMCFVQNIIFIHGLILIDILTKKDANHDMLLLP